MSDENYTFQDKTKKNYFTIIPNLIFELGLNSNEIAFYCFCKKVTGENGSCFYGTRSICEILQITDKTLKKCKETLVEKKLISLEVKSKKKGGHHVISIIDIMKENIMFFVNKYNKEVSENNGRVSENNGRVSENNGEIRTPKEELFNKRKESKPKKTTEAKASLASEDAHLCVDYLWKKLKEIRPDRNKPNRANWARDFDLMLKRDKIPKDKIFQAIDFAMRDDNNFIINSVEGLRRKYENIADHIARKKKDSPVADSKDINHEELKKITPVYERYKSWLNRLTDSYYLNLGFLVLEKTCFYHKKKPNLKYNLNYDKFIEVLKDFYKVPDVVIRG